MIQFGLSQLRAYTNGLGSGCAISTGGAGSTATVASGSVWIGGKEVLVSGDHDVDLSAAGAPSGVAYYIFAKVAAGASEVSLPLSTLTAPKQVVVFGDVGVWYKHTTGASTQKTYCDPYAIESKTTGLDFSTIYLGNDSASEVDVTVVAIE